MVFVSLLPFASSPQHRWYTGVRPIKKSNEITPAYLKTYITLQTVKSLRFTLCFHHVTQSYMETQQNVNFALKLTLSELTKTLVTSLQMRTFIYYTLMVASLPIWSYPSVEKIKIKIKVQRSKLRNICATYRSLILFSNKRHFEVPDYITSSFGWAPPLPRFLHCAINLFARTCVGIPPRWEPMRQYYVKILQLFKLASISLFPS